MYAFVSGFFHSLFQSSSFIGFSVVRSLLFLSCFHCSIVYSLFIHSPINGRLNCSQFFSIMNKAGEDISVNMHFYFCYQVPMRRIAGSQLPNNFTKWLYSFYTPTNNYENFKYFIFLSSTGVLVLLILVILVVVEGF